MSGKRCAFSLIEVLVASAIGLVLIALVYQWLTGTTRILTRGQNKMVDTNQAELVFRWIDQDVHTAASSPAIENGGSTLAVERFVHPDAANPVVTRKVVWTFVPGVDGAGSYIERAPQPGPGAPAVPATRFAVGALTASVVRAAGSPAHPGLSVKLTMKQPEDASVAVFAESFVFQNQIPDPRWSPVGLIPEP